MPEPSFRLLHIAEDAADASEELLRRIAATQLDNGHRELLDGLAKAIRQGVRYGGQKSREEQR